MAARRPLIVGEIVDEHVSAIVAALQAHHLSAVVFDAASMQDGSTPLELSQGSVAASPARGWIRRLAPATWGQYGASDSHEAAVASAWSALLTGIILTASCNWLTDLGSLLSAENKLLQLATADRLGLSVPRTVLARSVVQLREAGFASAVAKPLGRSFYVDAEDVPRVVAAQQVCLDSLDDATLAAAPFLFQERVRAAHHLRVVTVGDQAWVARLSADGLPLDWRFDDAAHDSFVPASGDTAPLSRQAVALAAALRVGYSSQDWIETATGDTVFLDLNPGGQWLFLPAAIAEPVTEAIAGYLASDP